MPDDKLQISWDELKSDDVEKRLAERSAVTSTQSHYQQASIPSIPLDTRRRFSLWYNTLFYLAFFGLLGGLLGWGFGEILHFRPDQERLAHTLIADYDQLGVDRAAAASDGRETKYITESLSRMRAANADNEYFRIHADPRLTEVQKSNMTADLYARDRGKTFIANLIFYGVSGMMIAVMLAIADSVVDRNWSGALVYGSIGAVVGLAGGVIVAVAVEWIQRQIVGDTSTTIPSQGRLMLASAVSWGLLGLFLAATPGIALRNGKRLLIGMAGGLIGGVIGGVAFVPLADALQNQHVARLVAILLIGTLAGFGSGLIEQVVKAGWLKVSEGLIAGKQFVLYRNPTFIGSAPLSHIYLFNDKTVGRRHACIHVTKSGYEIEDLPLGNRTLLNGRPISRSRLRNGDRIQAGRTVFVFQEKPKN